METANIREWCSLIADNGLCSNGLGWLGDLSSWRWL
jgi:hypothetical protein